MFDLRGIGEEKRALLREILDRSRWHHTAETDNRRAFHANIAVVALTKASRALSRLANVSSRHPPPPPT